MELYYEKKEVENAQDYINILISMVHHSDDPNLAHFRDAHESLEKVIKNFYMG